MLSQPIVRSQFTASDEFHHNSNVSMKEPSMLTTISMEALSMLIKDQD